jgi:decarbamoylnovobiocin carbamoyltransferase/7-O-carbamoyltransferase
VLTLGINGCLSPADDDFMPDRWPLYFHDAAAAVIRDGEVVAAIEQERLNRIKHTTAFPGDAAATCLAIAGAAPGDIDQVAFFFDERYTDSELYQHYATRPELPLCWSRQMLGDRLRESLGVDVPADRLRFVRHHEAHAHTAYPQSGFDDALVVVMDGSGEYESLSAYSATGAGLHLLTSKDVDHSLGLLYLAGTELLGYALSDEYKVMGLAPHGDPARYREVFQTLYQLGPDGEFTMNFADLPLAFFRAGFAPRRRGGAFTAEHRDFAAGLQETVERIGWHAISHWQRATGHRNLAIAGGVGQNCTLNGRLLRADRFDDVFVHPAAHDAGTAVGAALLVHAEALPATGGAGPAGSGGVGRRRIRDVFWGADLPGYRAVAATLGGWSRFCAFTRSPDVVADTARRLADGQVVGWVQGRAEFGPRALGHRSILADPRPASNRDRVNHMVKQRETYRPFAPSVAAERLREFFEYPEGMPPPGFLVFAVRVRPVAAARLGAVTHVDGTARVHAVDREVDPRFWALLTAFAGHTGVPVLLNTSFNNHAEPIVDSVTTPCGASHHTITVGHRRRD